MRSFPRRKLCQLETLTSAPTPGLLQPMEQDPDLALSTFFSPKISETCSVPSDPLVHCHHAGPERGTGFCIFNNVAITAKYAFARWGVSRIMIVDWDFHHGNGTQEIFWQDGRVLQFHTHGAGDYPGTGWAHEKGAGAAEGLIHNFPLPPHTTDQTLEKLYQDRLVPLARAFGPQLILVSAGYDAHKDDYLGRMALTTEGYGRLTKILVDLADELCDGRLIFFLEGGYNPVSLGESVAETIRVMMMPPNHPWV
eukprot:NODE_2716_length_876_cov_42.688029_g2241_i0.p1 GENE.NODE_2716_length_876_cov_42.688029_g2241_i0~~NODE_2716_length_876_cov_42.688029_g2241_i0.p1  ORF type:complete len:270 (+),score=31.70 NODE_2716_length_876_cov_42.688029_g2241_i0:53-811(+)